METHPPRPNRVSARLTFDELTSMERELEQRLRQPFNSDAFLNTFHASRAPYNHLSAEARALLAEHDAENQPRCLKLTLVRLLRRFEQEERARRYPQSIAEQFAIQREITAMELRRRRDTFFTPQRDTVMKDLAIFDERMIPGGAQLLESNRGIPRRSIFAGGWAQAVRAARFLFPWVGALFPYLELHTDPRRMEEFSPEGWDRFYARTVEVLLQRPEIKGILGVGWWNDPAVATVSPHLAYLRETPEANGAQVFFYGRSPQDRDYALVHSPERQAAFEEGRYTPSSYLIVWNREDMIRWARPAGHSG
ncbi:MAG: hypothetical protein R2724_13605 [Bryobacterales bacterium]